MRPSSTRFSELLACPACAQPLPEEGRRPTEATPLPEEGRRPTEATPLPGGLTCAACARTYETRNDVVDLRAAGDVPTETVRDFYTTAPFPGYPPGLDRAGLRARAARSEFAQRLDRAIAPDATIVEIGCGTGQMSLFLASADRRIVAADLTRASLELGASAARRFGLGDRVCFVETDLHAPGLRDGAFDVVYSSGVLHHTPDPARAFARIARLARPGGLVVVGLYNSYARLLHRLRRGLARLTGLRWIPFDPVLRARTAEPARREAWLRDQYLHPLEHRHTIGEVFGWFRANGIEPIRTHPESLMGGEPPPALDPHVDTWRFEHLLVQLGWTFTLAHEGGLFVAIGQRAASI